MDRAKRWDDDKAIIEWLGFLEKGNMSLHSRSAYEQSIRYFKAFVFERGIKLSQVKKSHIPDFVLERYQRGNSEVSIEHYIDCVRQFYKFHRQSVKVDPDIFDVHIVRKAYASFENSGISRSRTRKIDPLLPPVVPPEALKSTHKKFHPRG